MGIEIAPKYCVNSSSHGETSEMSQVFAGLGSSAFFDLAAYILM